MASLNDVETFLWRRDRHSVNAVVFCSDYRTSDFFYYRFDAVGDVNELLHFFSAEGIVVYAEVVVVSFDQRICAELATTDVVD